MQLSDFEFKTQPYAHQGVGLLMSAASEYFALFMDMGTGKTKVIIDTAAYLYAHDKIDAVVVVAPNGVHRNWVLNEIPVHMPDFVNCKAHYYMAGAGVAQKKQWAAVFKHPGLKVFCFNVESASHKKGQDEIRLCVRTGRTLFVIDESQRIKTPGAKRTQFLVNLAAHAAYRRILSGSPITQSPLDLYAQCKFLEPGLTGCSTNTAFRAHYAIIEQRKSKHKTKRGKEIHYDHIVKYKNIDELERRIAPHCYRVLKQDCLDLPDKVYERVYVELTPQQKTVYKDLLAKSVAALSDEYCIDIPAELRGAPKEQLLLFYAANKVTASNAMVKLLRLQQVICGSVPDDDGNVTPVNSNRITVLQDLVDGMQGKVIIWARFRNDIALIKDFLLAQYGDGCLAEFHGAVSTADRMDGVGRFQNDAACRFFLANQHSGGTGLTLTAATNVVYYSNDFSAEARWQSEDRAHRIGQKNNVTYYDLLAVDTVDEKILEALDEKKAVAGAFNYNALEEYTNNHDEDMGLAQYESQHGTTPTGRTTAPRPEIQVLPSSASNGSMFEDDEWV